MKPFFALLISFVITSFLVAPASAQDRYRLQSGDTVRIEVLEDSTLNQEALVRPDGLISVPFAGSIRAGGRTVAQIRDEVTQRLAPNFAAEPNVFVTLAARAEPREPLPERTMPVYVLGEVTEPGRLDVSRNATLMQVFAQMGGFTRFAATERIQLRRTNKSGQESVYNFNYDAMLAGASGAGATRMVPGDVVVVPQRRLFE